MKDLIKPRKKRILVDCDGPLTDFTRGLYDKWNELWPEDKPEKILNRDTLWLDDMDDFVKNADEKSKQIWLAPGYFEHLKPTENGLGVLAVKEMLSMDHEVYILTSCGPTGTYAASEKFRWIKKHMGEEWIERIIIAHHKNVVDGDILIDDFPFPNGENNGAAWEHVVYDLPYNRKIKNDEEKDKKLQSKRRINWHNWRIILPELVDN